MGIEELRCLFLIPVIVISSLLGFMFGWQIREIEYRKEVVKRIKDGR